MLTSSSDFAGDDSSDLCLTGERHREQVLHSVGAESGRHTTPQGQNLTLISPYYWDYLHNRLLVRICTGSSKQFWQSKHIQWALNWSILFFWWIQLAYISEWKWIKVFYHLLEEGGLGGLPLPVIFWGVVTELSAGTAREWMVTRDSRTPPNVVIRSRLNPASMSLPSGTCWSSGILCGENRTRSY